MAGPVLVTPRHLYGGGVQETAPGENSSLQVLATYFKTFLTEYETGFQRSYGYLRPVVGEVVERYVDCTNPVRGFARIRCPDFRLHRLSMISFYGEHVFDRST